MEEYISMVTKSDLFQPPLWNRISWKLAWLIEISQLELVILFYETALLFVVLAEVFIINTIFFQNTVY